MKTEILFQAAVLITFFKLGKKYNQLLHLVLQQKRYLSVNGISLRPLYSLCATKFIWVYLRYILHMSIYLEWQSITFTDSFKHNLPV